MSLGSVVWDAFINSDTVGKLIVLVLVCFSIVMWSVACTKTMQVGAAMRSCRTLFKKMRGKATCSHQILGELERNRNLEGPTAALGRAAFKILLEILKPSDVEKYALTTNGVLPRPLTDEETDRVQAAMEAEVTIQQMNLESGLSWVGSAGSLAPMLGLFGTVWGVMATFIGIVNNGGRPDIQAIAPGISGALLTTVAGLIVAIPAIIANNVVAGRLVTIDKAMDDFISAIVTSLRLAQVSPRHAAPPREPSMPVQGGGASMGQGASAERPGQFAEPSVIRAYPTAGAAAPPAPGYAVPSYPSEAPRTGQDYAQ